MSVVENFRAGMLAAGLDYAGPIHADGKLHRVKVVGDKTRNSWFVLHSGTPAAGAFGCWKRGIKETWCAKRRGKFVCRRMADYPAAMAACRSVNTSGRKRSVTRRRGKSPRGFSSRAKLVTAHAYLDAKGVKISGDVREYRGALVLPLHDVDGELHQSAIHRRGRRKKIS